VKKCPARVSQRAENYLKTNFTFTRVSQHNYAIYQPFISSAGVTSLIARLFQINGLAQGWVELGFRVG
jgi:hypothetical protein